MDRQTSKGHNRGWGGGGGEVMEGKVSEGKSQDQLESQGTPQGATQMAARPRAGDRDLRGELMWLYSLRRVVKGKKSRAAP